MKILVGTPSADTVDAFFYIAMLRLVKEYPDIDIKVPVGSTIYQARNEIAMYSIENDYDYLLFIDTDTIFAPAHLKLLIDDDKEMVAGYCVKRAAPYEPMVYDYKDGWTIHKEKFNRLTKVDAVGNGAMLLIKVPVLQDIYMREDALFDHIRNWSEDQSFFYRAKKCGHEVWCDPRVKLGHMGRLMVTEDFYVEHG